MNIRAAHDGRHHGDTMKPIESIAQRKTMDGQTVEFYSDGAVTLGHPMNNRLVARDVPRAIVWIVADEICTTYADEVKPLIAAARKARRSVVNGAHRDFSRENIETRRLTRAFFEIATARKAVA